VLAALRTLAIHVIAFATRRARFFLIDSQDQRRGICDLLDGGAFFSVWGCGLSRSGM
jgi:hypothetical protein